MTEIVAAHLERVARELAHRCAIQIMGTDDYESEESLTPLTELLAGALAACAREREERLEAQIVIAELEAQIIEATWWNEEGLDLENYISPEDAEKRLNFLRNTLKEVRMLERAVGEKASLDPQGGQHEN